MVSLSHAASLVQERAPFCPQSPLILTVEPRSGSWLLFRHQLQRLASGIRRLRQPQGKLESRRTGDHDPSASADSLLPCSPTSVLWSSGLSTGTVFGSRQQLQASGVSAAAANRVKSEATSLSHDPLRGSPCISSLWPCHAVL
ncbi:hypothetical protein NDU88_006471 [Pleurodeles waltl]|uniref:Uncharacterized protein n=1 Tax=Pleurodeles waltl TaxID=8319 RepID=A0AAV7NQU7_PLEWA|nr:hypothetical protein NDU88_006471 [Pleurodeles waltl]